MNAAGLFLTFEGTEGGGKTTQIQRLKSRLEAEGKKVTVTREPGGTVISDEIRAMVKDPSRGKGIQPATELLLMNAARAQLVGEVIRPALEQGEVVLSDRFFDSSLAYQGYGRGLPLDQVRQIIDFAVGEVVPDLTFFLHVPIEISEQRRQQRGEAVDRFEALDRDFFKRVEVGFFALTAQEPKRIHRIDSTRSIEAVGESIWEIYGSFVANRKG